MPVIAHLPRYKCAKNYQNRAWFDKVIAKIKWCTFLTHMGYLFVARLMDCFDRLSISVYAVLDLALRTTVSWSQSCGLGLEKLVFVKIFAPEF